MVYKVREAQRARIPAVTHVDDTGRLQTVSAATNPRYHALISEFDRADRRAAGAQHQLQRARADRRHARARRSPATSRRSMDVLALGNWVLHAPDASRCGRQP